ncbi:MAG: hypothetical protein DMG57_34470 [Acidobacteria bacterium]|nr:MAG: hypothetical protein DMG57_34470 [Acidobacteriota bacterium]
MSANATATPSFIPVAMPTADNERRHRVRLYALYIIAIAINLAIFIYGFDYYTLATTLRPFSPKHHVLRPSGPLGLYLGYFGVALFLGIFLYPIRKRWSWLAKQGNTRHWLDIHILMGLAVPFVVAFHSSLKFRGIAGMAFWLMFGVSLSGVVGRYLYVQIPRNLNAAELSRKELEELQGRLSHQLASKDLLPEADLRSLLRLPSAERIQQLPAAAAIVYMIMLDFARVFRIARVRRHSLSGAEYITTFGGMFKTRHGDLERAIATAGAEASLSKRILFLSSSLKVFHLWHVVHKPFSYTFAILAVLHIGLQFMLGFF